jgi:hypothetical protein
MAKTMARRDASAALRAAVFTDRLEIIDLRLLCTA